MGPFLGIKALIVADTEEIANLLREVCADAGIDSATTYDPALAQPGGLNEAMSEARFVLVGTLEAPSHQTTFEIGAAFALRKPLLLMTTSPDSAYFGSLESAVIVRLNYTDRNLLYDAITGFAYSLEKPMTLVPPVDRTKNNWKAALERYRQHGHAEQLESMVAAMFEVEADRVQHHESEWYDLVVWSSKLAPLELTPLLVEVVQAQPPYSQLRSKLRGLAEAAHRVGASSALLVYDGPNAPPTLRNDTGAMAISIERFTQWADGEGVIGGLKSAYPEALHGGRVWRR